ncbi:Oidioi.mRNA.OKI2018_I69.chr1.g164.t1.cds [Oikopleura dioica]|uniref:Oidioi.mRNA.OKI2018_I69.chr1.g164.t1.cds n=1 Tax=Oikopleura dioica TaxID=34765 RepID=A0ABN7SP71_OIKDI|nr:Oidioi.mRNA.OKI2018_I69.chr1.g164.t1.cds [Oikopleura dioica]
MKSLLMAIISLTSGSPMPEVNCDSSSGLGCFKNFFEQAMQDDLRFRTQKRSPLNDFDLVDYLDGNFLY